VRERRTLGRRELVCRVSLVALLAAATGLVAMRAAGAAQTGPSNSGAIRPFSIAVPDAVLKDLQERLARTRFPDQLEGARWTYGMNLEYLQQLVQYWRERYNWRAQEKQLNTLPQFKTRIDGLDIHFVHRKSPEPNALPIIMLHGWPGTFFEFHKMVEPLADPRRHGGEPGQAFDVVVPSLPGYGFSERPGGMGHSRQRTARIFAELMQRLGYSRYGIQAGDVGASVAAFMALGDTQHIAGLHLNRCSGDLVGRASPLTGATAEELAFQEQINARRAWEPRSKRPGGDEAGYREIQGTKPQTLGYSLNDSPVGLAAWILEKYRDWCDCDGNPETIFTKDELLTTVMIYWVTETATSAARYYYEGQHLPEAPYAPLPGFITVPTGCTTFPGDLGDLTPRAVAARRYNVQRFTLMPKGGHFAALEQPVLLTNEVRAFFRQLR